MSEITIIINITFTIFMMTVNFGFIFHFLLYFNLPDFL